MAPQVSTTRASRSPSLGLSLPVPLKGSARDKGSKTPRPSRLWLEELSGLASQRAAATGRGPDPDRHGARRAAPRRAGALTARRDAKPTSLRGNTFLMVAILAQLPPRASAEPHVTADRRGGVSSPLGRGFWGGVMTSTRALFSSFQVLILSGKFFLLPYVFPECFLLAMAK